MTRDNELLRRGDVRDAARNFEGWALLSAIAALPAVAPAPDLSDPVTVHANMLRGTIAKPNVEQIIHLYGADALRAALPAVTAPDALHRSFPEAGDGRPLPPMGDELMTAGLNAEDARFVAVQLAQNGWTLTPNPVGGSPGPDPVVKPAPTPAEAQGLNVLTNEDREWIDARADELFRDDQRSRGGVSLNTAGPKDYRDYFVASATAERLSTLAPAQPAVTPTLADALAVKSLEFAVSDVEREMAQDAKDAEHTGERPDLWEYECCIPYGDAAHILAALRQIGSEG